LAASSGIVMSGSASTHSSSAARWAPAYRRQAAALAVPALPNLFAIRGPPA
jgi:hypothetical protein